MLSRQKVVLVATLMFTGLAYGAQRTFVSGTGNDASATCAVADPCRSFTRALTLTDNHGEVVVLDSAGYGPVTISQSVALLAPDGIFAGISVFSGNGIDVAAMGSPGDQAIVVLRGLTVNGQGGVTGINFIGAGELYIEDCIVSNMAGNGLSANPPGGGRVFVKNSIFRNNAQDGALFQGVTVASIEGSAFEDNNSGLTFHAPAAGSVSSSVTAGNGFAGIQASAAAAGTAAVTVVDSETSNNQFDGISSVGSVGTVQISARGNLVFNNPNGLITRGTNGRLTASANTVAGSSHVGLTQISPAVFDSTVDNALSGNATDVTGTITSLTRH